MTRVPKGQPAPAAGQSQSGGPVPPAAPAASVATVTPVASVTTVEKPVGVPIGEAVTPVRLEPSLPVQLQPSRATVNVLGPAVNEQRQAVDEPSPAVNEPSQRPQVTEQPGERPDIVTTEGGPAVQLRDSVGRAGPQVGDSGPPLVRRRRPSAQAPSSRALSSPALVLAAGPSGHFDAPHTRAAEARHEPLPNPLVTEFTRGGRTMRSEGSF